MPNLEARLLALENPVNDLARQLPDVVEDETTDTELARLRKQGREVYRESDPVFIQLFV